MEQLPLTFGRAFQRDLSGRRSELIAALRGSGWRTAAQLRASGFHDRELREIVESDERAEILSYPGSPGYKLTSEATLQELDRAISLRTQARQMIRRYIRITRRRHNTSR